MSHLTAVLKAPTSRWDMIGITLSSLCLIHCIALPFFLALLPFGLEYCENESIHQILTLLALPVGGLALIPGFLKHRKLAVLFTGFVGLTMMIIAPMYLCEHAGHSAEQVVTGVGGVLLVAAHILNRRLGRKSGLCCSAC